MIPRGFVASLVGAFLLATSPLASTEVIAHENLGSENYPFKITFVKKFRNRYPAGSSVVKGADLFLRHKWIQAKNVFESGKKPDVTTLFFLYTINKSFGLTRASNEIIYKLARIPASRLKLFNSLMLDKEIKRVVYHYHRDHLTESGGSGRAMAAMARNESESGNAAEAAKARTAADPSSEWEVRPVAKDADKAGMERARNANGRYKADDPATPEVDEAWVKKESASVEKAESAPSDTENFETANQ